jgi:hypothetical protein
MSVYANLWARALGKDIIQGHPSQEKEKALYKHIIQELPSSGRVGVASGSRRRSSTLVETGAEADLEMTLK